MQQKTKENKDTAKTHSWMKDSRWIATAAAKEKKHATRRIKAVASNTNLGTSEWPSWIRETSQLAACGIMCGSCSTPSILNFYVAIEFWYFKWCYLNVAILIGFILVILLRIFGFSRSKPWFGPTSPKNLPPRWFPAGGPWKTRTFPAKRRSPNSRPPTPPPAWIAASTVTVQCPTTRVLIFPASTVVIDS